MKWIDFLRMVLKTTIDEALPGMDHWEQLRRLAGGW
jgi:hypothetical protein